MDELLRAKCKLYLELLKEYDNVDANVVSEDDILLMDALMRNAGVQNYLQSKLG
jgi:hypothetical protein